MFPKIINAFTLDLEIPFLENYRYTCISTKPGIVCHNRLEVTQLSSNKGLVE